MKERHNVEILGQIIGTCSGWYASDMCNVMQCDYDDFESLLDGIPSCDCLEILPTKGTATVVFKDPWRKYTVSLFELLVRGSERK